MVLVNDGTGKTTAGKNGMGTIKGLGGGQDKWHWCAQYPNVLSWPDLPEQINADVGQ